MVDEVKPRSELRLWKAVHGTSRGDQASVKSAKLVHLLLRVDDYCGLNLFDLKTLFYPGSLRGWWTKKSNPAHILTCMKLRD